MIKQQLDGHEYIGKTGTSWWNKATIRDLIAGTGLVILVKFDLSRRFFSPCDLLIWWMTSNNDREPLLYYIKLCASFQTMGEFKLSYNPETLHSGQNRRFSVPCDLEIWWWPWEKNGSPLYTTSSLCIISKSWVNSNWGYIPEMLNSGQNRHFLSCVTLTFDGWPSKIIGRLFYVASSFVHHFIAICEFKLELQSGNA